MAMEREREREREICIQNTHVCTHWSIYLIYLFSFWKACLSTVFIYLCLSFYLITYPSSTFEYMCKHTHTHIYIYVCIYMCTFMCCSYYVHYVYVHLCAMCILCACMHDGHQSLGFELVSPPKLSIYAGTRIITHEGRKFAGRFAGKDANCCAFVSQPKQPLVKARSGRLGSERIAAAAVVLLREVGALLQAIHSTPWVGLMIPRNVFGDGAWREDSKASPPRLWSIAFDSS